MSLDQNTIKKPESAVCPGPKTPTENHCINCEYDGLREYRTLCLHPDSETKGFWHGMLNGNCCHFVLWSKRVAA